MKTFAGRHVVAYRWYVVAVLMTVSVLGYVDRLVLGFLVDPIKADLSLTDTQIGVLTGVAFALFYVLMGLPLGRWIDTGRRTGVLALCVASWSAMTALCGAAVNFVTLFLGRMGVASGEAALNPAAVSIISDLFPRDRSALPISIFSLGIYIGGGLALIVGGQLIDLFSRMDSVTLLGFPDLSAWRLVFFAVGLPGIVVAGLLFFTVREPERHLLERADREAGASMAGVSRFLGAHRSLYLWLFGGTLTFGFYLYAVIGWYPAMLMRTYGLTAGDAALGYGGIYLGFGVAGALSVGPLTAALKRRGTSEASVVVCFWAMLIMALPAALGPLAPSTWLCLACFAVAKFCWALTITTAFVAIAEVTPNTLRGLVTSVFMAAMNVTGGAFGAVIVGALSDQVFGPEQIRYALALNAAVFVPIAAGLFFVARKPYRLRMAALHALTEETGEWQERQTGENAGTRIDERAGAGSPDA